MVSLRPYMIRAIYEWAVDNEWTPMLGVRNEDAAAAGAQQEPYVFYNIAPQAVRDLVIDEDGVRFHARFGGRSVFVEIGIAQVISVFCKETQAGVSLVARPDELRDPRDLPAGMMFVSDLMPQDTVPMPEKQAQSSAKAERPHLRLVRPNED